MNETDKVDGESFEITESSNLLNLDLYQRPENFEGEYIPLQEDEGEGAKVFSF